jgi:hypothetical protein
MPWTTPGTAVAGAVLEATFWNSNVRDNTLLLYAQSQYPYRNLLYNGAMQIAQRGTSTASITTSGYYTADRWSLGLGFLGTWTQSVENDAPTGSGLRKSLKMLCTTADASPAAGDTCVVEQKLEGFDVQRIAKGTTSAQTLTLSFWVKANVTGTYIAELYDADNTRQISKSYTITASGTWEKKELTFPADTTGVFDNDNGQSLSVIWWLASGSTYTSGTLNSSAWNTAVNANRAVGQTNLASTSSQYWQVTGVQLEVGSVATPFESLPYGDELARCQRYFYRINGDQTFSTFGIGYMSSATDAQVGIQLPVTMRSVPSALTYSAVGDFLISTSASAPAVNAINFRGGGSGTGNTTNIAGLTFATASSLTAGTGASIIANNRTTAWLALSAEL